MALRLPLLSRSNFAFFQIPISFTQAKPIDEFSRV